MRHAFELFILITITIKGTITAKSVMINLINNIFRKLYLKIFVTYNISKIKFVTVYFMITTSILHTFTCSN